MGFFLWDKNGIFHRVYIIDIYYAGQKFSIFCHANSKKNFTKL